MTGFHHRHRELLVRLLDDEAMGAIVDRVGGRDGDADPGPWRRTWARIVDAGSPRVQLSFERDGDTEAIAVVDVWPDGRHHAPGIGAFDVRWFPDDHRLPGLGPLLSSAARPEVVRYRPGKRCTLRTVTDGIVRYVKTFPDQRGARMDREARALHRAATRGELAFGVAGSDGHDARTRAFTQFGVPGRPAAFALAGGGGPELAHRLGAALASLPASGLAPEGELAPRDELRRARRRTRDIAAIVPCAADELESLMAAFEAAHAALRDRDLVPIHGSPHTHQWLVDDDHIHLVDFDRFSLGDPELDVATFVGEYEHERGSDTEAVNRAFVLGFSERHGPLDRSRLALYRAHKRLAKAHRTARSPRLDAAERTVAHICSARGVLTP